MVTAHESAHQWWGNILLPGRGPGANVLAEGMAHFSTILLTEQVKGQRDRIELCKRFEERYCDNRQVDSERPLVWVDGTKAGDTTVMYEKGGWAMWMLLHHMGRDAALAGLQDFVRRYAQDLDHPVLQDFLAVMREHAADRPAFDDFTGQWYHEVVMPEYRIDQVETRAFDGGWSVTARVTNDGTGRMPVEIAAVRGERFPDASGEALESPDAWHEARTTVTLAADESQMVTIDSDFEPERIVVDPDLVVLMLQRERVEHRLGG